MNLERESRQKPRKERPVSLQKLLRPREVAARLAVSRSTVYRWYWEGKLKGVKLGGGTVRILESSVEQKMAEAD
jgi:excisionase family DNA binding protein